MRRRQFRQARMMAAVKGLATAYIEAGRADRSLRGNGFDRQGRRPPAHASAVGPDPGAANPVAGIALECTDPRARLGGRRSAGEPLRPLADVAQSSSCPVSSKDAKWRTTIRTLDSKVVDLPNQLA